MNLHIVTVGTSILSNLGWQRPAPLPPKARADAAVAANPRQASAEINALLPYVERGLCQRVHLIATDTPEGRLCRDVVGAFLGNKRVQTELGTQADLLPGESGDPYAAAAHLRDRVFSVARAAHQRGDSVYLNLTGGLKSETAVAAATATLLDVAGIPVTAYYAHESMPEPVELPILSVGQDVLQRLARDFATDQWVALRGPLDSQLRTAERERVVRVQRSADGTPSTARLTDFGRFLVERFSASRP